MPINKWGFDVELYWEDYYLANSIADVQHVLEPIILEYTKDLWIERIFKEWFSRTMDNSNLEGEKGFLTHSTFSHSQDFRTVISNAINKHFKSGLKTWFLNLNHEKDFIIKLCVPSNKSLREIENKEILWAIGFQVSTHLTPRYKMHWDAWNYSFVFEIRIMDSDRNTFCNYELPTRTVKKSEVKTTERDASVQRSAEAHRARLMNVVSWGLPSLWKASK